MNTVQMVEYICIGTILLSYKKFEFLMNTFETNLRQIFEQYFFIHSLQAFSLSWKLFKNKIVRLFFTANVFNQVIFGKSSISLSSVGLFFATFDCSFWN